MIVYDLEGNEHDMPSVDARECVKEMGWTLEKQIAGTVENTDGDIGEGIQIDSQGLEPVKYNKPVKGK